MQTPKAIQESLPNVWSLFFMQHGRPTTAQLLAIPPILAGKDVLLSAATATGKTEAVMAPLLQQHWQAMQQPGLHLLYICPTRALVRDLYERLQPILIDTGIAIGMKTGDIRSFSSTSLPAVLITTPESTDSLLTRIPRLFSEVRAIVLDEIHLLDNSVRGDQVRCLLPRIEQIRQFAHPGTLPAQRLALSATVAEKEGMCRRYLQDTVIIDVPGSREIVAEIQAIHELEQLATALAARKTTKTLLFCNSRKDVEEAAALLRRKLPYQAEILVHYSNLDAQLRRDIEDRFAALPVAICVCTSTLELGIDIGSVNDIVLFGAPPDLTSFLQRIGRGGRRTSQTQVLCLARAPGEWARFEALLRLASGWRTANTGSYTETSRSHQPADEFIQVVASPYGFRPSVLIQQIFSRIKQSPSGAIRLADVRRFAPPEISDSDIRQIVSHLCYTDYLQPGRPGEWKPGTKLQEVIDRHDFYSNIGPDLMAGIAVDAHSGAIMATTDRSYPAGTVLLLAGKPMEVVWRESNRYALSPTHRTAVNELLRVPRALTTVPYMLTRAVAQDLGYEANQLVLLPVPAGAFLFHFWGTVWGEMLAAVLLETGIDAESHNEYCISLTSRLPSFPPWDETIAQRALSRLGAALAGRLQMGRFHGLLPDVVAIPATARLIDIRRFAQLYRAAEIVPATVAQEQLHLLAGA